MFGAIAISTRMPILAPTCCTLIEQDGRPQIIRKTVRLNNDYIRQVIDVYHI